MIRRSFVVITIATAAIVACGLVDPFPDLAETPVAPPPVAPSPPHDATDAADHPDGCTPGQTRSCGFEVCTGVEKCSTSRTFGACDARNPKVERCNTTFDESCDGYGGCTGAHRWGVAMKGAAQRIAALEVDRDDNMYIAGNFTGELTLGTSSVAQGGAPGIADGFVVKLSRAGTVLWLTTIPDVSLASVSIGASDLVVTGIVLGATPTGPCGPLAAEGPSNVFAARVAFDGSCKKAKTFGQAFDVRARLDVPTDEVVVTGSFKEPIGFGGPAGSGADILVPSTAQLEGSVFVVRLGPDLVGKHGRRLNATSLALPALAVSPPMPDPNGGAATTYVVVAGHSNGGGDVFGLPYSGAFIGILDRAGALVRAVRVTQNDASASLSAATFARDGAIVLVGGASTVSKPIDLGPFGGPVLSPPDGGTGGMLLLRASFRLDAMDGAIYGVHGFEEPRAVTIDGADNVVVAGTIGGRSLVVANLGGADIMPVGNTDGFIAKYGPTFEHLWSHGIGTIGNDGSRAVGVSSLGDVFVGMTLAGMLDADGGPVEGGPPMSDNGAVLMRRP